MATKFWLEVGSDKITADHDLTYQRQNINHDVSENFDSDLNNLKFKEWKIILTLAT